MKGGKSTFEWGLIAALIAVAIIAVVKLFSGAAVEAEMGQESAPKVEESKEAPELEELKWAEVQFGCHEFGTVTVDGPDRVRRILLGESQCVRMEAMVAGQSAYIVVDLPAGYAAPKNDSGFMYQGDERGLQRFVYCYFNKDHVQAVRFEVPLLVVPSYPSTIVRVGVYHIAENETCAGWRQPASVAPDQDVLVPPILDAQDAGDGGSHGRDAE